MVHSLHLMVLLAASSLTMLQAAVGLPIWQHSMREMAAGRNRTRFMWTREFGQGTRSNSPSDLLISPEQRHASYIEPNLTWMIQPVEEVQLQGVPVKTQFLRNKRHSLETEPNTGLEKLNLRHKPVASEDLLLSSVADVLYRIDLIPFQGVIEQQEKRTPRFSPWGGKRNDFDNTPINTPSTSGIWGGGKRVFSSWGGKRDPMLSDGEIKRTASWGGKRGNVLMDGEDVLMPASSSWGGKRFGPTIGEDEKRGPKFSSWGGKREGEMITEVDKRASKFSSWGGKRDQASKIALKLLSWGIKRDGAMEENQALKFSDWGGNKDGTLMTNDDEQAIQFSSWVGNRNSSTQFPMLSNWNKENDRITMGNEIARAPNLLRWAMKGDETLQNVAKRAAKFSSWGGKRVPGYSDWNEWESRENDSWGKGNITNEASVNFANSFLEVENEELSSIPHGLPRSSTDGKDVHENFQTPEIRIKYSIWGGKRSSVLAEPLGDPEEVPNGPSLQKRDVEMSTGKGKSGFPMEGKGGKRSMRVGRFRTRQINSPPLRQNRRGADFYPWGGKRADLLFFSKLMDA